MAHASPSAPRIAKEVEQDKTVINMLALEDLTQSLLYLQYNFDLIQNKKI